MVQSQEPAETRPRSKAQSANLDTDETFSWLTQNILMQQLNNATTYLSTLCGNHTITHFRGTDPQPRIIFSRLTQAKLSSNNSDKLSLLADKHLVTFLGCTIARLTDQHRPCFYTRKKKSWPGSKFTCNFALT